jgi:hypothetical protein
MMNSNIYEYLIEARMAELTRRQRAGEFPGSDHRAQRKIVVGGAGAGAAFCLLRLIGRAGLSLIVSILSSSGQIPAASWASSASPS